MAANTRRALQVAEFWRTYRQELQSRAEAAWGTGEGYDWHGFPANPEANIGSPGPRLSREGIDGRVVVMVHRMQEAFKPGRFPPSFHTNAALKAAAKKHGFTSAKLLQEAINAAEPGRPEQFGIDLARQSHKAEVEHQDGLSNGDMQGVCEAEFGMFTPECDRAIEAYRRESSRLAAEA